MVACKIGDVDIVKFLVSKGANVHCKTEVHLYNYCIHHFETKFIIFLMKFITHFSSYIHHLLKEYQASCVTVARKYNQKHILKYLQSLGL